MSLRAASDRLVEALGLDQPPVALAVVDEPPAGVAADGTAVPSACTFWRRAEKEVLFAPAEAHFHCPIGAFVMGFDLPAAVEEALGDVIGQVVGNGYIGADEPSRLPRLKAQRRGILYGPLADFPVVPDAVLAWLSPAQAMIWSEASGGASWGAQAPASAFGRPACAAIPAGLGANRPVLSLGCTGMRTFTEVGADRLLGVLPGGRIKELVEAVVATVEVNAQMKAYYEDRREQVVAQST